MSCKQVCPPCGYPPCGGCCRCLGGCQEDAEFQQMEQELASILEADLATTPISRPPGITGQGQLAAYRAAIERQTRFKCAEAIEQLQSHPTGHGLYDRALRNAADHIRPDDGQTDHDYNERCECPACNH